MNRITPLPDFIREWTALKAQYPQACAIIKANLNLLKNAEPRTLPEIQWNAGARIYTWSFAPEDTGAPFPLELDFYLEGNEVILAALEIM